MRLMTNVSAMAAWRALSHASSGLGRTLSRLATGLRIGVAADDPAGLGISEKLLSRLRGLQQANRNAGDGANLIRTAEGALDEVHAILQRARELAVLANNGTLTPEDRSAYQGEVEQLLAEIDRIAEMTEFNGIRLLSDPSFSAGVAQVLSGLRRSWLEQSELLVSTHYGLAGDNVQLRIVLDPNLTTRATNLVGTPGAGGRLDNLELRINVKAFSPATWPNGGQDPVFNDRLIAREVTRAVMARAMDYTALPNWFREGSADFIAGADEMLLSTVSQAGINPVVDAIDTWADDAPHRSSAYLAIKYLDMQLQMAGAGGIRAVMDQLALGTSLDNALLGLLGIDATDFIADFKANGGAYYALLDLTDADVGSINPGDKYSVIPDIDNYTDTPMANFQVLWPTGMGGSARDPLRLQVGPDASHMILLHLPDVTVPSLDLLSVDLVRRSEEAIGLFDTAIIIVSGHRTYLGSMENRLEHTGAANEVAAGNLAASREKIRDADMAKEAMEFARWQIMVSTSTAMMAQANAGPKQVLRVLLAGTRRR